MRRALRVSITTYTALRIGWIRTLQQTKSLVRNTCIPAGVSHWSWQTVVRELQFRQFSSAAGCERAVEWCQMRPDLPDRDRDWDKIILRPRSRSRAKFWPRDRPRPIFTARCYASAVQAMALCPSLRPSVRPSLTSRCSTKTAKRRITQTTPHDSPGTLVFGRQRSPRNSTGVTPCGGAKYRWGGSKSATFDKLLAISRKRYTIDA